MITITSREFNQNKSRLLKAIQKGPVVVTNRGEPSLVVLTYRDYCDLKHRRTLGEAFRESSNDVADIDWDIPRDNDPRGWREVQF